MGTILNTLYSIIICPVISMKRGTGDRRLNQVHADLSTVVLRLLWRNASGQ